MQIIKEFGNGRKYNLQFLSDAENKDLLLNIANTMYKFRWYYNRFALGKYAYWENGPIWKFGDSKEVTECRLDETNNINRLQDIINSIFLFYSQSIVFNKLVNDKVTSANTNIIESTNMRWKEVSIAFELNDLLNFYENLDILSRELKEIFIDISVNLKPYYAMASIEMSGLVEEPKFLKVEDVYLGDFNYFSFGCFDKQFNNITIKKHETYEYGDLGMFVFTTKHIGKYSN